MKAFGTLGHILLGTSLFLMQLPGLTDAKETDIATLQAAKAIGAKTSKYLKSSGAPNNHAEPKADLKTFHQEIKPILNASCVECHGPKKQKGKFRVDTLDPDLVKGKDIDWWLEIVEVLTHGEMPPPEEDVTISEVDRAKVIDWLSGQVHIASKVQRSEAKHTSFRRMTRYEWNYALQDLLAIKRDFTAHLPPETSSEDGFKNSSEGLQITAQQLITYQGIAREALLAATVRTPKPKPTYFAIKMDRADAYYEQWVAKNHKFYYDKKAKVNNDSDIPGRFNKAQKWIDQKSFFHDQAHFLNQQTGRAWSCYIPYGFSIWEPANGKPTDPPVQDTLLVLPHGASQEIDLGNHLPDRGIVKIRFRASRATAESDSHPSIALYFGHKPNNNSSQESLITPQHIAITSAPGKPEFYEFLLNLDAFQRNPYLRTGKMGMRPTPTEYISFKNSHQGTNHGDAKVYIDYIEITAPHITVWPPVSHQNVFPKHTMAGTEAERAHAVITNFMPRAWRRSVGKDEIDRKVALFHKIRPQCADFQEAIIEVLATVLSSPHFLYLSQSQDKIADHELATRLSFLLWSSQPDAQLLELVASGQLRDPNMLAKQAERMLADPRSKRFTKHFTRQWLGMDLLDLLQVNKKDYPSYTASLKTSMQQEPIELFQHLLTGNHSIIDFIHADYTFLNQRLARHYGIENIDGNHFRKVVLPPEMNRGGLLTQAGLLAMNSDGKDSHPLKRGIWMLENILHDPPPPPPPAVPEIDLTDPRILKMTLKERMEDHRNKPACFSCHSKIDPWGIAFENFDATGAWRDEIAGKPVDASSKLYNKSELKGITGLKQYLLVNRQDQFARAMVHKLASYALGRPLNFADHAELERITTELRQKGDGLRTLIMLLVESKLFQTT